MILVMDYRLALRRIMKNNKIIIGINHLTDIEKYKKIGITNFLFALADYSIGYQTFKIDELKAISGNVYLNINKIMDTKTIEDFKKNIKNLTFVKGIFFDDLGIYQVLKDSNIPLIWHQSHFVLNSRSVNFWLERVDSACLSHELTITEIKTILDQSSKSVILNVFGLNPAMYSRRHLLSTYCSAKGLKEVKEAILKTKEQSFIAKENQDGTFIYYQNYFNYLPYLDKLPDEKILFYYINPLNLDPKAVIKIINGETIISEEKFLNQKTIYKLED